MTHNTKPEEGIHQGLVRFEDESYPHFFARTYHTRMMEKFQALSASHGLTFTPDDEELFISALADTIEKYADHKASQLSPSSTAPQGEELSPVSSQPVTEPVKGEEEHNRATVILNVTDVTCVEAVYLDKSNAIQYVRQRYKADKNTILMPVTLPISDSWIANDYKTITGFNTPEERHAYDEGFNAKETILIDWIKRWNGSTNSGLGQLLSEKFQSLTPSQEPKTEEGPIGFEILMTTGDILGNTQDSENKNNHGTC